MAARDVGTSARRRRERRLRAQWRHEQQSIAGPVSHNVLRNQNTAREGTGVLRDVRGLRCGWLGVGRRLSWMVVAVQTLGWRETRALLEQLAARPGRDTNTGHRDGG